MNQQNLKYQLLADLLATLEAEEFPIGIGKHLELQQLYSMLPEDIVAEEMKTLLAPIFAKNKQDQEFFYDVFDQSLRRVKSKTWQPKNQPPPSILPKKSKWEVLTRLLGILLLSIIALLFYLRITEKEPPPFLVNHIAVEKIEVKEDTIYAINLLEYNDLKDSLSQLITNDSLPVFISFVNGELVGAIHHVGNYQIDSLGNFTLKTEEEIPLFSDTISVISNYQNGEIRYDLSFGGGKNIVEKSDENFLEFREHPFPKDLSQLFPETPPVWYSYFQENKIWIKSILIFLLFALFGTYFTWYDERQQKIITDIQSKNDPPLLWNIQIPNISKITLNEDYFKVLQQMRQRTSDDHVVLNIPKTINKTIAKGGIIDFQYQYKTRPPEYLLLIDRQSSKNHRAYLYDYMFESFKANEVYIERFFYEGDIRLCWNEYYPNGIKLQDLQQTFRDARLIIVGSGYQLLNPVTGKLAKWTRIFDNWSDKAILSPRPTKNWAGREKQLKQKFILLPASIQSLTVMVDKMEAIDPDEIKTKINDQVNEPIEFRGSLIETLHHYFSKKNKREPRDESLVHWIAACAIYPTLHWDLTMYLGQELSSEDNNLLTFDHINQLTRLPWFIEGKIPEQARLELLEYLPEDVELKLRNSLKDLFDTIPPPNENSVAFADSRINISLNKYVLEKNNLLKTELNQYARAGADIDVTMLKYLEGEKSPKDFEVDPNLRKYAEGKKPNRINDRWTNFLSFLLIGLTIGILMYNPNFENCTGELVTFKDLELCLNTPDDHLIYHAAQIREKINHNKYNPIDSLEKEAIKKYFLLNSGKRSVAEVGQIQQANYSVASILPFVKNDSSILHFYQNLGVDFYNHGVPSYNRFDSSELSFSGYYDSSKDSVNFCIAFEKAKKYDNKIEWTSVSAEIEFILKINCFVDLNIPNPESENLNDVLVERIGGRVFDKATNKRLPGVEVNFLGEKIITNSRGRYEFEVPQRDPYNVFNIGYSKKNYQSIPKEYSRRQLLVAKSDSSTPLDLDDIFMEKNQPISCYEESMNEYKKWFVDRKEYETAREVLMSRLSKCEDLSAVQKEDMRIKIKEIDEILRKQNEPDLTCFEKNKKNILAYFEKESYELLAKTIEQAKKCELGELQENEIRVWEKELEKIIKAFIASGDSMFKRRKFNLAKNYYTRAVAVQESTYLSDRIKLCTDILEDRILLDERDNKTYNISQLKDGRIWMLENLNYEIPNSFCVNGNLANCKKWGRLYPWAVARRVCPEGWRLPSETEWNSLSNLYGYSPNEIYTNLSKIGFTNQLGGYRDNKDGGKYYYTNIAGVLWTNSRNTKIKAYIIDYNVRSKSVNLGSRLMTDANSCRCIKNQVGKK